ncbi:MAG: Protein phosphatase 2C [candidate division WS6 bacterium OLB20]|uniref:Protein phosphatase 2C n=1 Tax=candidate division WS6 bacterium OLB20 TaxID=1617426 RepID=A0A136M0S5_9BACT|nr:MAG: Protein phosphatase 2C [candidate division WS6 bacterium OLB20]
MATSALIPGGHTDRLHTGETGKLPALQETSINPGLSHKEKSATLPDGTRVASLTDIGGTEAGKRRIFTRTENNDAAQTVHLVEPGTTYTAVYDGVGVKNRGDLAAATVMTAVRDVLNNGEALAPADLLEKTYRPFMAAEDVVRITSANCISTLMFNSKDIPASRQQLDKMLADLHAANPDPESHVSKLLKRALPLNELTDIELEDAIFNIRDNLSFLGIDWFLDPEHWSEIPDEYAAIVAVLPAFALKVRPSDLLNGFREPGHGYDQHELDNAARLVYGLITGLPVRVGDTLDLSAEDIETLHFRPEWLAKGSNPLSYLRRRINGCKTTATMAQITGHHYEIAYAGDTPAFLLTVDGDVAELLDTHKGADTQIANMRNAYEDLRLTDSRVREQLSSDEYARYESVLMDFYQFCNSLGGKPYNTEYVRTAFSELTDREKEELRQTVYQGSEADISFRLFRERFDTMPADVQNMILRTVFSNLIVDDVGVDRQRNPRRNIHTVSGTIAPGDMLLIGSDGFFERISNAELSAAAADIRNGMSPEQVMLSLKKLALARGTSDNLTAQIIIPPARPLST